MTRTTGTPTWIDLNSTDLENESAWVFRRAVLGRDGLVEALG